MGTGASARCQLDGAAYRKCASPKRYRRLDPGRHVFRVHATDPSGNQDPKPATREWKVKKR